MSDKAIYSVDTVETITDNDKIYVNTGDNIKQIKRSDLFIDINSNLDTLEYDVAELKNDLSVKKFDLVADALWLCVSGKHCVLTLNGYNLTETTHFDKLEEYQPYLAARNVVSKVDSVCMAAVDTNGNINASDLAVGTSLTGQLFGEISWIANI